MHTANTASARAARQNYLGIAAISKFLQNSHNTANTQRQNLFPPPFESPNPALSNHTIKLTRPPPPPLPRAPARPPPPFCRRPPKPNFYKIQFSPNPTLHRQYTTPALHITTIRKPLTSAIQPCYHTHPTTPAASPASACATAATRLSTAPAPLIPACAASQNAVWRRTDRSGTDSPHSRQIESE
jgi:hypothetical protein